MGSRRLLLAVALGAWVGAWAYGLSDGFDSWFFVAPGAGDRLLFSLLALLVVVTAPVSGHLAVRRTLAGKVSALRAALTHVGTSLPPLLGYWLVLMLLVRLRQGPGRVAFEAYQSMWILYVLLAVAVTWAALAAVTFAVLAGIAVRRRRTAPATR